jgi:hypothetical protein
MFNPGIVHRPIDPIDMDPLCAQIFQYLKCKILPQKFMFLLFLVDWLPTPFEYRPQCREWSTCTLRSSDVAMLAIIGMLAMLPNNGQAGRPKAMAYGC